MQYPCDCESSTYTRMVALYESREELEQLFHDDFMQKYTTFQTFEEFTFSGAVFVKWNADFIVEDRQAFDCCVKGKTRFNTWQEMYDKAYEEKEATKDERAID
ncbi:hypothetical protein M2140_000977 [Clostridiales Family XIII bacterium PM5-7]